MATEPRANRASKTEMLTLSSLPILAAAAKYCFKNGSVIGTVPFAHPFSMVLMTSWGLVALNARKYCVRFSSLGLEFTFFFAASMLYSALKLLIMFENTACRFC